MHFNWSLRRHNRALHPHSTAVVNPVIESISNRSRFKFQSLLVSFDKVCIVFGSVVVLLFMLVKVKLKLFLLLDDKLCRCEFIRS